MSRPAGIIRVTGLRTQFGRQVIHDDLNLAVEHGEIMGIVGASGTGKSVLIRNILGLMRPIAGRIEVLDQDVLNVSEQKRRVLQRRFGVLFQDGALFSSLTVAENIVLPIKEHTKVSPELREAIAAVKIKMVGLPLDTAHKHPSQLSGGMRKRAALARSLALDPEILFLDEPTSGLDPVGAVRFDRLINDLREMLGLTVVMVTHDLDTVNAVCDRISVLVDKHLLTGTIDSLLRDNHPWINEFFDGPRGRTVFNGGRAGPTSAVAPTAVS